jgi:metal-responsive CopG/Arc/MetJ family transcriptional regulator
MLIPEALLKKIDEYAEKIGETRSSVIRKATREFLYGQGGAKE